MSVKLRKKIIKGGRVSLYLDIYSSGKRKSEFLSMYLTGEADIDKAIMQVAQRVRAEKELELVSFKYDFTAYKAKDSFIQFSEPFIASKSPANQHVFHRFMFHFRKFAGINLKFEDVHQSFCSDFRSYLLKQKITPTTACLYFTKFRTIVKEAIRQGIILKDPTAGFKFPHQDSLPKYLTFEELKLLANTPTNPVVKNGFLFGCVTGLRLSDIYNLKWTDINHNSSLNVIQKKTGRRVMVYLNPVALRLLESSREFSDGITVFNFPPYRTLCYQLKTWAKKAGIDKPMTFHWSRHSFATMALNAGVDIYTVSKLLGHSKLATTQVYAQVMDKTREHAVNLLPELLS